MQSLGSSFTLKWECLLGFRAVDERHHHHQQHTEASSTLAEMTGALWGSHLLLFSRYLHLILHLHWGVVVDALVEARPHCRQLLCFSGGGKCTCCSWLIDVSALDRKQHMKMCVCLVLSSVPSFRVWGGRAPQWLRIQGQNPPARGEEGLEEDKTDSQVSSSSVGL